MIDALLYAYITMSIVLFMASALASQKGKDKVDFLVVGFLLLVSFLWPAIIVLSFVYTFGYAVSTAIAKTEEGEE